VHVRWQRRVRHGRGATLRQAFGDALTEAAAGVRNRYCRQRAYRHPDHDDTQNQDSPHDPSAIRPMTTTTHDPARG
jgi:ribosomal protein S12 methylthiotransferase accessory factor YcaO